MKNSKAYLWIAISILLSSLPVQARMLTQITPTLTITEEYNDNYFQTGSNKQEEWITSYGLEFSVGFLDKKSQIYLLYNPEYKDYKNLDDRDGLDHNASIEAAFQPTKFTSIQAELGYDGHSGSNQGESWEHTASAALENQFTKTVSLSLSHDYSNAFDQQVRTGIYKEHKTNTTKAGIRKKFGANNSTGLNFNYEFDDYKNSDADEYTKYQPSAFFKYWFTRLDGMESNLEFEKKEFDNSIDNDFNTISGDIRYIRKFTRHFDGYVKYRHYLSDRTDGDHTIYHPSVGFDWQMDEDSGISLGIGVQFHKWDNENNDSTEPFLDIDAYKVFNFSRRGSLTISGSSGYEEANEDAGSLGYNTHYQLGFSLDYQMMKRLSSSLFGTYKLQDFSEDEINRKDDTMEVGGRLIWSPLKWMQLSLNASHTSFNTDDALRDDYEENQVTFFVKLIPEKPIRPDKLQSRKMFEKALFD